MILITDVRAVSIGCRLESALRRQGEPFDRTVLRRLIDPAQKRILAFECGLFAGNEPQYRDFIFGNVGAALQSRRQQRYPLPVPFFKSASALHFAVSKDFHPDPFCRSMSSNAAASSARANSSMEILPALKSSRASSSVAGLTRLPTWVGTVRFLGHRWFPPGRGGSLRTDRRRPLSRQAESVPRTARRYMRS